MVRFSCIYAEIGQNPSGKTIAAMLGHSNVQSLVVVLKKKISMFSAVKIPLIDNSFSGFSISMDKSTMESPLVIWYARFNQTRLNRICMIEKDERILVS